MLNHFESSEHYVEHNNRDDEIRVCPRFFYETELLSQLDIDTAAAMYCVYVDEDVTPYYQQTMKQQQQQQQQTKAIKPPSYRIDVIREVDESTCDTEGEEISTHYQSATPHHDPDTEPDPEDDTYHDPDPDIANRTASCPIPIPTSSGCARFPRYYYQQLLKNEIHQFDKQQQQQQTQWKINAATQINRPESGQELQFQEKQDKVQTETEIENEAECESEDEDEYEYHDSHSHRNDYEVDQDAEIRTEEESNHVEEQDRDDANDGSVIAGIESLAQMSFVTPVTAPTSTASAAP